MKQKQICPSCGGSLRDETIGWRCKKCRGFISMQDGKFYEYVEKPFMPPMTNADRIRAMSDEELAEFITDKEKGWLTEVGRQMYYDQNLEWLKQPAEMPKEE